MGIWLPSVPVSILQSHSAVLWLVLVLNFASNTDLTLWKLKSLVVTLSNSWSCVSLSSGVSWTALSTLCISLGFSLGALVVVFCRPSRNGCYSCLLCSSSHRLCIFLTHVPCCNTDISSCWHFVNCLCSHLMVSFVLLYQSLFLVWLLALLSELFVFYSFFPTEHLFACNVTHLLHCG